MCAGNRRKRAGIRRLGEVTVEPLLQEREFDKHVVQRAPDTGKIMYHTASSDARTIIGKE